MDRTIQAVRDGERIGLRLCDGDQVLAERWIDLDDPEDYRALQCAAARMQEHASGSDTFEVPVRILFPEFGTAPAGVAPS